MVTLWRWESGNRLRWRHLAWNAGRTLQETGRTHPTVNQCANHRNAQNQQSPKDLVVTTNTWAAQEVLDGLRHEYVLNDTTHNNEGSNQKCLHRITFCHQRKKSSSCDSYLPALLPL